MCRWVSLENPLRISFFVAAVFLYCLSNYSYPNLNKGKEQLNRLESYFNSFDQNIVMHISVIAELFALQQHHYNGARHKMLSHMISEVVKQVQPNYLNHYIRR